uniref:Uncharacterized protein LOC111117927 n=1 Tax=Crassostrea virginica TaxID=6565 RepID=A0A8B8CE36_CRAVI|nr:uncharacterized protein LOC111117927 [Crassostrea virginica]
MNDNQMILTLCLGGLVYLSSICFMFWIDVFVMAPRSSKNIEDSLTEIMKYEELANRENSDWIYLCKINLRQEGFTKPYALPNCVFLEKNGIPVFLADLLIFWYWESHCNSAGIKLPKSTREGWNDIYFASNITQKSRIVQFGSKNGVETVKLVHLTTILTHTGFFSLSGLLVICEHEYDTEKVILKEHKSALFGIFSWEEFRVFPRSLSNLAIKALSEVFRRNALFNMKEKQHKREIEEKNKAYTIF